MISLKEVNALREQGLTWQEIGDRFKINKSIPWKMEKHGIETMQIGNKKRYSERDIVPVWEILRFDYYKIMRSAILKFFYIENKTNADDFELYMDFCLNYLYAVNSNVFNHLKQKSTEAYFFGMILNLCRRYKINYLKRSVKCK